MVGQRNKANSKEKKKKAKRKQTPIHRGNVSSVTVDKNNSVFAMKAVRPENHTYQLISRESHGS